MWTIMSIFTDILVYYEVCSIPQLVNSATVCMHVQLFAFYPDLDSGNMLDPMIIKFSVISGASVKIPLVTGGSRIAHILTSMLVSLFFIHFQSDWVAMGSQCMFTFCLPDH